MAALEDLINRVADITLRDQLAAAAAHLKSRKKFGLIFEEHIPELALLPGLTARRGARVVKKDDPNGPAYRVVSEVNGKSVRIAPVGGGPDVAVGRSTVAVAKTFGEPMYPALIPVGAVSRGGDKPWHVLINAENYYALQLLLYGYERNVDVIYIDPPYNTGARDWKYNNNYVDKKDQYRHSKWLSMMKKRLELARRLLKPDGVMVVAIDDYEAHRLRFLVEDVFGPTAFLGVVVVRSKPSGTQTDKGLAVSHEYAMFIGGSPDTGVATQERTEAQLARFVEEDEIGRFWWENLRRAGSNSRREDRRRLFYPIWVTGTGDIRIPKMEWDDSGRRWVVNETRPYDVTEVLPIRPEDGTERNWSWSHTKVKNSLADVKAEPVDGGYAILRKRRMRRPGILPHTIWYDKKYSATEHGTNMLRDILGEGDRFSYPKSLYTVVECLRCASDRTDAVVLDFFGGSGTTLHAVAALNAEDGGTRRCILVTNNEVGEKTAKRLTEEGHWPGDDEWEREGICESVTWPRVQACLSGQRPDGTAIPISYLDGRSMAEGFDENVAYFRLDFLDPGDVSRGEEFQSILPILWMLAGCQGACELSAGEGDWFIPANNPFAVLINEDAFSRFLPNLEGRPDITCVFLVTDSTDAFHEMTAEMGRGLRTIQLYRSYIDTFRINLTEPGTITPNGVPSAGATASVPI